VWHFVTDKHNNTFVPKCFVVQNEEFRLRVSKGMVDSGANIGITSYDIARLYGREIQAYEEPLVIHGVGEITTTAFHFSDFGPILGEMALL